MMATFKKRSDFLESEEGRNIRSQLQRMALDNTYNTAATYSSNSLQYPDNLMSFVDKHMNYLNVHPKVEASQYLANLQLMTRIR
jgi:hypothetical protein